LRLDQPNCRDAVGGGDFSPELSNGVRGGGIEKFVTCNLLLSSKLLADQFARDAQRSPRQVSQRLSTPQLGIRRANRTCRCQDGAIPFQHDESCVLIRQPTQRGERHHSVRANYDEASKTMSHSWKTCLASVQSDPILKKQVSAIHADLNAVAK
jgi:hypothetical protein